MRSNKEENKQSVIPDAELLLTPWAPERGAGSPQELCGRRWSPQQANPGLRVLTAGRNFCGAGTAGQARLERYRIVYTKPRNTHVSSRKERGSFSPRSCLDHLPEQKTLLLSPGTSVAHWETHTDMQG